MLDLICFSFYSVINDDDFCLIIYSRSVRSVLEQAVDVDPVEDAVFFVQDYHAGAMPDSVSMSSYKDYPAHCPFVSTLVHHTPQTRIQYSRCPASPSKAFPETKRAGMF